MLPQMEQTQSIDVELPNGQIIKVEANIKSGAGNVAGDLDKKFNFADILSKIEGIADGLVGVLEKVKPSRASVEFGVKIGVETSGLTAILAKGTGEAELKITLEWEKEKQS